MPAILSAAIGLALAQPLLSHALIAAAETAVLTGLFVLIGLEHPAAVALLLVTTVFYAREAGQREHDLKNAAWSPLAAWAGATLWFGWSRANLEQWLAPTAAAPTAAALIVALLLG